MEEEDKSGACVRESCQKTAIYSLSESAANGARERERKTDVEDDIRLLLDCLRFQSHCVSSQRQALSTMATMCAHSSESRDLFRATGALSFVVDLLYRTDSLQVQQAALYTLGCAAEKNVVNQMKLSDEKLLSFLADLLKPHPPATPTSSHPALMISIAYLCGCVMSGNAQGQNSSRETRLLHRLVAAYKCHLPKVGRHKHRKGEGDEKVGGVNQSVQVWTSISSALCTANNNPQNEMNQCVCSQLLPAALSLIGDSPLSPDILRPAISFITSCVANNGTTQGRLRMIGGLQILVSALKELCSDHDNQLTNRVLLADLAVHIVQALSAAIFTNATNTDTLCQCGVIGCLLTVLQWEGLDDHAHLSIVMCLSMLTEDRVPSQQELISSGGLQLLLSILSGSREEGLSKAITFVLQCCLPQQEEVMEANKVGDETLRAGIARVEKLLSQSHHDPGQRHNDLDQGYSDQLAQKHHGPGQAGYTDPSQPAQNTHNISTASSTSQGQDHSTSSAAALRPPSRTPPTLLPTILHRLDSEKLPIKTTIDNWLKNADPKSQNNTDESEKRNDVIIATRIKSDILVREKVNCNVKGQSAVNKGQSAPRTKEKRVCDGGEGVTVGVGERSDSVRGESGEGVSVDSEALLKEKRLRQELERKLEKESMKRKQLEKLVKQAKLAHQALKRNAEKKNNVTSITQEDKVSSDCNSIARQPTDKIHDPLDKNKESVSSKLPDSFTKSSEKGTSECMQISDANTVTPTSTARSFTNRRYATSASHHYQHGIGGKMQANLRVPKSCLHVQLTVDKLAHMMDKEKNRAREKERREDKEKSRQYLDRERKEERLQGAVRAEQLLPANERGTTQDPPQVAHRDGELSRNCVQLCRQPSEQSFVGVAHSSSRASDKVRKDENMHRQQFSSDYKCGAGPSCEHSCLACKPRLKCTTLTSRNFIQTIQFDRFTCSYHKSLMHSLVIASNTTIANPGNSKKRRDREKERKLKQKQGNSEKMRDRERFRKLKDKQSFNRQVISHVQRAYPSVREMKGDSKSETVAKVGEMRERCEVSTKEMRASRSRAPHKCSGLSCPFECDRDRESSDCERLQMKRVQEREELDFYDGYLEQGDQTDRLNRSDELNQSDESDELSDIDERDCHGSSCGELEVKGQLSRCHRHCWHANERGDSFNNECNDTMECSSDFDDDVIAMHSTNAIQTPSNDRKSKSLLISTDDSDESSVSESLSEGSGQSSDPNWSPTSQSSIYSLSSDELSTESKNRKVIRTHRESCARRESTHQDKNCHLSAEDYIGEASCSTTSKREGETSSAQNKVKSQVTRSGEVLKRAAPQYSLVAGPKQSKKVGVLKDLTNRGRGGEREEEGPVKKRRRSCSLSVFDYNTPKKRSQPSSSKVKYCATGEVLSTIIQRTSKRRIPWTTSEEENLVRGVTTFGLQWRHILSAYTFHPNRDPVSLKDKYRNMRKYLK